jgi:hypothetical protein
MRFPFCVMIDKKIDFRHTTGAYYYLLRSSPGGGGGWLHGCWRDAAAVALGRPLPCLFRPKVPKARRSNRATVDNSISMEVA